MSNTDVKTLLATWTDLYPKGKRYRHKNAAEDFIRIMDGKSPNHIGIKTPEVKALAAEIAKFHE